MVASSIFMDFSLKNEIISGNFVTGYMPSLVYLMNNKVSAIWVSEKLPPEKKRRIMSHCHRRSIKILNGEELFLLGNLPQEVGVVSIVKSKLIGLTSF